ncbi:hypothetical protein I7I48_09115 [Histoplasma ohiense]|nr:hypothetical protein I7I48_09115 [Histoplasma ohiense (nom. inval.)]
MDGCVEMHGASCHHYQVMVCKPISIGLGLSYYSKLDGISPETVVYVKLLDTSLWCFFKIGFIA